uniref:Serine/threonine kinase 17b (apoptosis-inducing) n=1 Tax=Fundulus heteroclitus TaxID=8078 RepID=A0A3Q2P913_FUNHE
MSRRRLDSRGGLSAGLLAESQTPISPEPLESAYEVTGELGLAAARVAPVQPEHVGDALHEGGHARVGAGAAQLVHQLVENHAAFAEAHQGEGEAGGGATCRREPVLQLGPLHGVAQQGSVEKQRLDFSNGTGRNVPAALTGGDEMTGSDITSLLFLPSAPEILNYEPITTATDLWSVGVIAYMLVTGESPFAGDDKQETYLNVSQVSVDYSRDAFTRVSELAVDFIRKLLVKAPEDRPSAAECLSHPWLWQQPPCLLVPEPVPPRAARERSCGAKWAGPLEDKENFLDSLHGKRFPATAQTANDN